MKSFITDIKVSYSDGMPGDAVQALHGSNPDINAGFGGSYVWLIPVYSNDPKPVNKFATGFYIQIIDTAIPGLDDLAKGAGGDFRYLITLTNVGIAEKVTEVILMRSDKEADLPKGYSGMTTDINKGRKKDYLYLLWKSEVATEAESLEADESF